MNQLESTCWSVRLEEIDGFIARPHRTHLDAALEVSDSRAEDENGIDAHLTAWLPYVDDATHTEVSLHIQIKATIEEPRDDGINYEYRLRGANRYDDLRSQTISIPRLLVVLFLPSTPTNWLSHTPDELVLRRCAYWQSLRNAPSITTKSAVIKLPKVQVFSPSELTELAVRISRHDIPVYSRT